MTKRKFLFSLISVMLLLVVAVCAFVACDPKPEKFTVTFKNGESVISTLSDIEKGTVLTAEQIPTLTNVPADKEFVGWYVGEGESAVKVEAGYIVNGSVNVLAKLNDKAKYTVTFKNGNDVVDTLTNVIVGTALTTEQIPTLQDVPNDKLFDGWYVGEGANAVKVEAGYVVNGNVIALAKLNDKAKYTVTFKNGDDVVSELTNVIDGTALVANQIPTLQDVPTYKVLVGWYVGEGTNAVKVEANYVVSDNVTVYAKFKLAVTIDSEFAGVWDTNRDSYLVTISQEGIFVTSDENTYEAIDVATREGGGYTFSYKLGYTVNCEVYYENGLLYFSNDDDWDSPFELIAQNKLPKALVGSWSFNAGGSDHTLVITEDSLTYDGTPIALSDIVIEKDELQNRYNWTFTLNGDEVTICTTFDSYNITFNEDSYIELEPVTQA